MKLIFALSFVVFIPLFLFISSFSSAQSPGLVGKWKMVDLRCANASPADAEIKKQVLAMSANAELIFSAQGGYTFNVTGGSDNCPLESSGFYRIESPSLLKLNITSFITSVNSRCKGNYRMGEQSVDYELQGEEFLIYQPLGYLKQQLCGADSRVIQVLKKQK